MKNVYNPERGFFNGKAGVFLKVLLIIGVLAYPASIEADAVLTASSSTASSTVVAAPMTIPVAKTAPAIATTTTPATDTKLVWITAYASVPDETSAHPFITASGAHVADGIVAANWLPFGTQIEIPSLFGNKIFTVEDRMNQEFNNRLDIWMPNVAQAVNFGLQHAKVVILDSSAAVK